MTKPPPPTPADLLSTLLEQLASMDAFVVRFDDKRVEFTYKNKLITMYPTSNLWHYDDKKFLGRGLKNLKKQLK